MRGPLPDTPQALAQVRCFLFLQYETALGSNVHVTPVYEALKLAVPDAKIIVACGELAFKVLKHNTFVDYLIQTPDPYTHLFKAAKFLRSYLRSQQLAPEAIITTVGNVRRTISLLAFLAAKALRVGYSLAPSLYHFNLQQDISVSLMANNLRLIRLMGYTYSLVEPRVAYASRDVAIAKQLLQENDIGSKTPRVVLITQTSKTQRRSWPVEKFVEVVNHLHSEYDANLIFVGTSSEAEEIESIRGRISGTTVSLAGRTTIQTMAALLASSDLALTLDTGNMHVARSVGLPMVILAPAWAPGIEWLPEGFDQYSIFMGGVAPWSPPGCEVIDMDTAQVIESADHLLRKYPPSEAARRQRVERGLSSIRE